MNRKHILYGILGLGKISISELPRLSGSYEQALKQEWNSHHYLPLSKQLREFLESPLKISRILYCGGGLACATRIMLASISTKD